jgi:uncharacterized 2Fe-2S/4Fe-4S cluster protein (DUF4445 family)
MTHYVTSRVNEMIGIQIGMVQQAARKLQMGNDIEVIEADVAELEKSISALKEILASVPHHA